MPMCHRGRCAFEPRSASIESAASATADCTRVVGRAASVLTVSPRSCPAASRPARPECCLYHAGGPTENGGWCVVEVWKSREALDRFFQEKLGQALQQANIDVQLKFFQVHNTVKR